QSATPRPTLTSRSSLQSSHDGREIHPRVPCAYWLRNARTFTSRLSHGRQRPPTSARPDRRFATGQEVEETPDGLVIRLGATWLAAARVSEAPSSSPARW